MSRWVGVLLVGALSVGCSSFGMGVTQSAPSGRGAMGFGVLSLQHARLGITSSQKRVGLGASSDPSPGAGDFVYRLASQGMLLQLCHVAGAQVSASEVCKTAVFLDGGANTIDGYMGDYPVLIDPDNLGAREYVVASRDGAMQLGLVGPSASTVPATPWNGVWAIGPAGRVHHCRMEGSDLLCRGLPADAVGTPLAVRVYESSADDPTSLVEAIWIHQLDSILRCTSRGGPSDGPSCVKASVDGPLTRPTILFGGGVTPTVRFSEHALARGVSRTDIVWLWIVDKLLRCEATTKPEEGQIVACTTARVEGT